MSVFMMAVVRSVVMASRRMAEGPKIRQVVAHAYATVDGGGSNAIVRHLRAGPPGSSQNPRVRMAGSGKRSMFAVIQTGGKQYKVAQNDVITVERLAGEAGASIELGAVLAVGDGATLRIGAPLVPGASVTAEGVDQTRGPKSIILKKRRRQNSRRKNGHRQDLTVLKITGVKAP